MKVSLDKLLDIHERKVLVDLRLYCGYLVENRQKRLESLFEAAKERYEEEQREGEKTLGYLIMHSGLTASFKEEIESR